MGVQNQPPKEVFVLDVKSPARDLLFYERVEAGVYRDGKPLPAMGTVHPRVSRWPNYELSGILADGEEGWLRFYYAKTRASQEAYNWEYGEMLDDEYPTVRQTWAVKRNAYAPGGIAAPPSLGGRTWVYKGERQLRTDPTTDGLFVVVTVDYWDISGGRSGVEVDLETGEVRPFTRQPVVAGSSGQAVDADGQYREVMPINRLWSLRTTKQLAGLGGSSVSKSSVFHEWKPYRFPGVLSGIFVGFIPAPGGSGFAKIVWRPVWKRKAFSGPCRMQITESWSKTAPEVVSETQLLTEEVRFHGGMLLVDIEPCLHEAFDISEGTNEDTDQFGAYSFSQGYEATSPTDLPATVVAQVNVTRSNGGYFSRVVLVDRPANAVDANAIFLSLGTLGLGTAGLSWSSSIGSPEYRLDVCKNALFNYDFVSGYNAKDKNASTSETVAGLETGVPYYARVRHVTAPNTTISTSNIVALVVQPLPVAELVDVDAVTSLPSGSTLTFDSTVVEDDTVINLRLTNTGEALLTITGVGIAGTHAADFATSLTAQSIDPGDYVDFTVTASPSVEGTRTAALTLTNDSTNAPALLVNLSVLGIDDLPHLVLESPVGVVVPYDTSVPPFTYPLQVQVLRLKNTGIGLLSDLVVTLDDSSYPGYFQVSDPELIPDHLDPGAHYDITLNLTYVGAEPSPTATLYIESDDADFPGAGYIVHMEGTTG